MTTLSVPDFKTSKDFVGWVDGLEDKEIQSWNTKDWLALYEKLFTLVDNDEKLKSEYLRHIKELEQNESPVKKLIRKLKTIINPRLNQIGKIEDVISVVHIRRYFVEKADNIPAFIKLYNNYRFEPQQLKAIKKLAKDNGQKISSDQDIDLSEISGIMSNSVTHSDDMLEVANKVDKIVKENVDLPREKSAQIFISKADERGSGYADNSGTTPVISLGYANFDSMLEVMLHEASHAHLQNSSMYHQSMLTRKNKLPIEKYAEELNKDFYKLMEYNDSFYLNSDIKDAYAIALIYKNTNMTSKELDDKLKALINGYKKQPVERYSFIFGIEAEREFRHQNKQNSERPAFFIKRYLKPLMGEPVTSKYVDGNIQIEYNSYLPMITNKELIRRFNFLMDGADAKLLKAMNIHEEANNVVLTVPTEHSFRKSILEIMQKNHFKNSLFAYRRNRLAQKIDKAATSIGIASNLQDHKMSAFYKKTELKISRDLEKSIHTRDFTHKQMTNNLKEATRIIKSRLKSARQFIKSKLSKER